MAVLLGLVLYYSAATGSYACVGAVRRESLRLRACRRGGSIMAGLVFLRVYGRLRTACTYVAVHPRLQAPAVTAAMQACRPAVLPCVYGRLGSGYAFRWGVSAPTGDGSHVSSAGCVCLFLPRLRTPLHDSHTWHVCRLLGIPLQGTLKASYKLCYLYALQGTSLQGILQGIAFSWRFELPLTACATRLRAAYAPRLRTSMHAFRPTVAGGGLVRLRAPRV